MLGLHFCLCSGALHHSLISELQECLHWARINTCIWLKTVLSQWCKCHYYVWGLIPVLVLGEENGKEKTRILEFLAAACRKQSLFWIKYNFPQLRAFQFQISFDLNSKDFGLLGRCWQVFDELCTERWWMDNHIPDMAFCRFRVSFWAAEHNGVHQLSKWALFVLIVAVIEKFSNVAQGMGVYIFHGFFFCNRCRVEFKRHLNAT